MTVRSQNIAERLISDKSSRWSLLVIAVLVVLSVFGGCIANDKPVFCTIDGTSYWPIAQNTLSDLGLARLPSAIQNIDWRNTDYDRVAFAPIAYGPGSLDLNHTSAQPSLKSDLGWKFVHWLGTDQLGRDTLSGLIHGARIAVLVGLGAMALAAFIGIPLGAFGGYFGNDRRTIAMGAILVNVVVGFMICYYISQGVQMLFDDDLRLIAMRYFLMGAIAIPVGYGIKTLLRILNLLQRDVRVPWDAIVMRSIEILRSIPAFFLLFAVLGVIRKPSILYVVLLIAVLHAPTVIRYVRAEALKLREQTFVDAARAIGLSDLQIVRRHIIPNTLGPVLISIAFGIGGAVLLESGLSFLGIGLSLEQVSWGKMLNAARSNFSAWWLAVFPGIAIFLMIGAFNRLGDQLTKFIER